MSGTLTKADPKVVEPPEEAGPEDDKPMTFWEHLDELRKRVVRAMGALLVGAIVAWVFRVEVLAAICKPFQESWVGEHIAGDPSLHFATPGGVLTAYVKLSLIAGACIAAPVIFYQLWSFVAPGLYAREKRYVIPFVLFSTLLFVGGGWFGYVAAFPFTFGYFFSLAGDVGGVIAIKPTVMMEEYIDFVVQMFLGFGLVFELPILLTFLGMIGVINHKKLIRFARYYVFIAFFVAAVLTPPDWTSQIVMAVPAIGLYFISIGLVYIFQKREDGEGEEEGAAGDDKGAKKKEKKRKDADPKSSGDDTSA